jgi:hypothetical protein
MSLAIFEYNNKTNEFDPISSGTQLNPVTTTHNGVDGQSIVRKLFLQNADDAKWYDVITLTPNPQSLTNPANQRGWSVKLLSGDRTPTGTEWSARTTGTALASTLSMATVSPRRHYFPEIGKAGTEDLNFYPFWLQITVPKGTRNLVEATMSLDILAQENNV